MMRVVVNHRLIFIQVILFLFCLQLFLVEGVQGALNAKGQIFKEDKFFLHFNRAQVIYNLRGPNGPSVQINGPAISTKSMQWELKKIKPSLFHLRRKDWKDTFWKFDTDKRMVYSVNGRGFGSVGLGGKVISGATASIIYHGSARQRPMAYVLTFAKSRLAYDGLSQELKFLVEDKNISNPEEWDYKKINSYIFQLRYKGMLSHLQVDKKSGTVAKVSKVQFGLLAHKGAILNAKHSARAKLAKPLKKANTRYNVSLGIIPRRSDNPEIVADLGLLELENYKKDLSPWLESEKELYREYLTKADFDVLVVPFQVQGYGIDRIGRSIMTRYIAQRIETDTGLKVADPTMVARALGKKARTFTDEDIYNLARELNVKLVVKGYVGHNLEEKMILTVLAQSSPRKGGVSKETEMKKIELKEIPFSDLYLPSDAFYSLLDEVMSSLRITGRSKGERIFYEKASPILLQSPLGTVLSNKELSPIQSAYYLQLLGSLYPERNVARDSIYERSLVILNGVDKDSPDYRLLKARALFHLKRRPAALAALGTPKSKEEKAFLALLDGDLPALKKSVKDLPSSIGKAMLFIELNDLRWSYSDLSRAENNYNELSEEYPSIAREIYIKTQSNDRWALESNINIKILLDETLPVEGFTAKGLFEAAAMAGMGTDEIAKLKFSVYNHRARFMNPGGDLCCSFDSHRPVGMDYMDLLYAHSEYNLFKTVGFQRNIMGVPHNAMKVLDSIESLYVDHPSFISEKISTLKVLSKNKVGRELANYQKEIKALTRPSTFSMYREDYPGLPYGGARYGRKVFKGSLLHKGFNIGRIKDDKRSLYNNEVAVGYSHDNYYYLKNLYETFNRYGANEVAEQLLENNKHRFIGNPVRDLFLVEKMKKEGDLQGMKNKYEKDIEVGSINWQIYEKLADLYIKEGNTKKALEVFESFPPFKDSKGANRVQLSGFAGLAALKFYVVGAIDEATPLLERSAGYKTGSGMDLLSRMLLARLRGDYHEAGKHAFDRAKRYKGVDQFYSYIANLNYTGYTDKASTLFDSLIITLDPDILRAAMVGHRVAGKSNDEILEWVKKGNRKALKGSEKGVHILQTHIIDRAPNPGLAAIIESVEKPKPSGGISSIYPSHTAWFADAYYNLKKKKYSEAYKRFNLKKREMIVAASKIEYTLPYMAWSAAKGKKLAEFDKVRQAYKNKYGIDFNYQLSDAFIAAGKWDYKEAARQLKKSRYHIESFVGKRAFIAWYQLLEAAQWLYEDSGEKEFKVFILEMARMAQRLYPMHSWGYSFEAKHTGNANDRVRALGISIYLDRNSERISGFTEKEKKKARKWFEANNPFRKQQSGDSRSL